jgi:hypothetical protein
MECSFGELKHVFVERGKSGKNTNRPELQRLLATRAARGLFNGGRIPVGYRLDPQKSGHFIIDEQMANVVRHAFPATCRDKMPGKSAHGRGGKIAYYEHSWASKRASTMSKEILKCAPHRVLARRLEPLVWEIVRNLLTWPEYASAVVEEARQIHRQRLESPERDRLKKRLSGLKSQLETLAERLSTIPKGVPTGPIFEQMKKLDEAREETENLLVNVEGVREGVLELPAQLEDYQSLLSAIRGIEAMDPEQPEQRELCRKIIHRLVHKIEIMPDHARIHIYAGQEYVQSQVEAEDAASPRNGKSDGYNFFGPRGSRTLTIGAHNSRIVEPLVVVRTCPSKWTRW